VTQFPRRPVLPDLRGLAGGLELAPDVGRVQSGSSPAGEDEALIAPLLSCRKLFLLLSQVPFARSGQYEWHRMTIEARMRCGSVRAALDDEAFPRLLHGTLQRWGMGRRASVLVPLAEFRQRLPDQAGLLAAPENARIDDPALDVPAVCRDTWQAIGSLGIVRNHSLTVPGTKTLHHILPDLVPPMDRAWTGAFFLWSATAPQYAQAATFTRTFTGLTQVARDVQPTGYTGGGWRTSRSKVLDNAIIGYCRLSQIPPVQS